MTELLGLVLDAVIVVLLVATIVYAATLSRRLNRLRDSRQEMEEAVKGFAEAATKADAAIKGLKHAAEESGAPLQKQIDRAQGLRDELRFLIEAAESLAGRLESAAGGAAPRATAPATDWVDDEDAVPPLTASPPPARPGRRPRPASPAPERSRNEPDHELLKAIENMR